MEWRVNGDTQVERGQEKRDGCGYVYMLLCRLLAQIVLLATVI